MIWTIEYTTTAKNQLRKLDRQIARRILDYMDERVAPTEQPRSLGTALSEPLGAFWRYRVGDYRIVCDIQDNRLRVLVVEVGSRGRVYRRGGHMFRAAMSG